MTDLVRAVDCSAWTGEISANSWDELDRQGVSLVIVQLYGGGPDGVGSNPYARGQLEGALARDKRVAGYSWPPASWALGWAEVPSRIPLEFLALDVEAGQLVGSEHVAGVAAQGLRPWIYTSLSQWRAIMNDSPLFADFCLWDAVYPLHIWDGAWPGDLYGAWEPYGGWVSPAGWQFVGTTDLGGDSFDLNVFDPQFLRKEEVMKLRLVRGDASDKVFAIDCSGRKTHVLDPAHRDALIVVGVAEREEIMVVYQALIDAIPDASGERP